MVRSESLPSADDFEFHCDIDVRFRDVDAMGHVNNAAYITYFEIARTGYMNALGHAAADATLEQLFPFILLDVYCQYLAAAENGQRLRVYLRTTKLGTKSFEFEYLITNAADGHSLALGRSTQVYYDYQQKRTLPLPSAFRQRIETLEDGEAVGPRAKKRHGRTQS